MLACWCRGRHISRREVDRKGQSSESRHLQHTVQLLVYMMHRNYMWWNNLSTYLLQSCETQCNNDLRPTIFQTHRRNYDPQDRASIPASLMTWLKMSHIHSYRWDMTTVKMQCLKWCYPKNVAWEFVQSQWWMLQNISTQRIYQPDTSRLRSMKLQCFDNHLNWPRLILWQVAQWYSGKEWDLRSIGCGFNSHWDKTL